MVYGGGAKKGDDNKSSNDKDYHSFASYSYFYSTFLSHTQSVYLRVYEASLYSCWLFLRSILLARFGTSPLWLLILLGLLRFIRCSIYIYLGDESQRVSGERLILDEGLEFGSTMG